MNGRSRGRQKLLFFCKLKENKISIYQNLINCALLAGVCFTIWVTDDTPILATVNLSAKSRTRHLRSKLLYHIVCAYTWIQLPVCQVNLCLRWSGLGPSGNLLLGDRQNKKTLFVGYSASCQQETWAEMTSSRSACKLKWCVFKAMSPLLCTVKVVPGTGGVLRLPQVHV